MQNQKINFDRSLTNNQALLKWLDKMVEMCTPKEVRWCDGSDEEWEELTSLMIGQGSMIKLNEQIRPNSFLVRSDPRDVAGWRAELLYVVMERMMPEPPIIGKSQGR